MPVIELLKFLGMSTEIAPEKMPDAILQEIVNLELQLKDGYLKKRSGYKEIIASGLTNLKGMFEFVDKGDNRQILLQDGSTLKESVYSGGSYGSVSAITNDMRPSGSTVTQMYPILYNKELRSGAGIGNSTDKPFWYGYIPERKRFRDSTTISAGKYLCSQYCNFGAIDDVSGDYAESQVSGQGLDPGTYIFYFAPVLDGYQKGFPEIAEWSGASARVIIPDSVSKAGLSFGIYFIPPYNDNPRVTHLDVFIVKQVGDEIDLENSPAYFLQRIDLNSDGDVFYIHENAVLDPSSQIITLDNIDKWKTFSLEGLVLEDVTNGKRYIIDTETIPSGTTTVELTLSSTGDSIPTGATSPATVKIKSGWDGQWFNFIYDNYHVKLGSEMYAYLNLPAGSSLISDGRYKYIANNGEFSVITGLSGTSKNLLYYSVPNSPDIFPDLNVVSLPKEPTGLTYHGNDFLVFYKDRMQRLRILGNEKANISDDDSMMVGCSAHSSIIKLDAYTTAWMSYYGPVLMESNSINTDFGQPLREWWEDKLSDSDKEACVAAYNHRKQWILFSFPTYSDSDYPDGIVFVFDFKAHKAGKLAWWILKTDTKIYNQTLADDLHLLTGDRGSIVDWNNSDWDEDVVGKFKVKMIKNPLFARRIHLDRIFLDFDAGGNNIVCKVYVDGSTTPTMTITVAESSKEEFLRYIAETVEIEILADCLEFTFKNGLITYENLRV